ncbi:hypothetical protein V6N12_020535 [Hibiscus sabdariffa]|uniref:RNase H type-1 domain-containing protein n=1 Tax=Hibiscus sabdariffa TaxID=183260 RepID=A0ABR2CYR3_9ROSI
MSFCLDLGISASWPSNPTLFLEAWTDLSSLSVSEVWSLLPFVIIWTLWLFRNDIVFNDMSMDWINLKFLIKFRLATWLKAKFDDCPLSIESIMVDPFLAKNHYLKAANISKIGQWISPSVGFAKLNTDCAVLSRGDNRGGGGVLRGSKGEILFQFSESCPSDPPSLLELLSIKIRVFKFLESRWSGRLRLIVESDCKLTIDWLSASVAPPANLVGHVTDLIEC